MATLRSIRGWFRQAPGRGMLAAGVLACLWTPVSSAQQPPTPGAVPAAHAGGEAIYLRQCSVCHGARLEGHGPSFPPLGGVTKLVSREQIVGAVRHGLGRMPPFSEGDLPEADLASLFTYLATVPAPPGAHGRVVALPPDVDRGNAVFQQYCSFCHGRDAAGGDTGPDLTRSRLVAADKAGDQVLPVVHEGRPEKGMPRFALDGTDSAALVSFLHYQAKLAATGTRRGVEEADLRTGDAARGRAYFNGAGGCTRCHSAAGDLAGVASRHTALELERQMLYPANAKDHLTATGADGTAISGVVVYQDEFHLILKDAAGRFHTWPLAAVQLHQDSSADAHIALLGRYTDPDIHDLEAYLLTLK